MGNENQIDPPDERKAWSEPRLVRLDIDLRNVEEDKFLRRPHDTDDHVPPS